MKKFFENQIVAMVLILITALSISACGGQTDNSDMSESNVSDNNTNAADNMLSDNVSDSNTDLSEEHPSDNGNTESDRRDHLDINQCHYCSDYSDGFAWNIYGLYPEEMTFRTSVIDRNGKMIFNWDSEISAYSYSDPGKFPGFSYENGYAYLETNNGFNVIDTSGKVLYTCTADSENIILAYGDGYVIARNYFADFDTSGYTYVVYSPDGSVVSETKSEYELDTIYYCGRGIFGFYMNEEENCYFYNAGSDTLFKEKVESPVLETVSFKKHDDIVYIGANGNWQDDGEITFTYKFLDINGKIISAELGADDDFTESVAVSGSKCIIKTKSNTTEKNKLYIFDSATGEVNEINLPYEDKILWEKNFDFGEEKIVVPVQGDDNKQYVIVIDETGKLLLEPTLARQYTGFTDNRIILTTENDICVYNENMTLVYALSQLDFINLDLLHSPVDMDYYSLGEYSDGVAVLSEDNGDQHDTYLYLDIDGNRLFEKIDMSSVIDINSIVDR